MFKFGTKPKFVDVCFRTKCDNSITQKKFNNLSINSLRIKYFGLIEQFNLKLSS